MARERLGASTLSSFVVFLNPPLAVEIILAFDKADLYCNRLMNSQLNVLIIVTKKKKKRHGKRSSCCCVGLGILKINVINHKIIIIINIFAVALIIFLPYQFINFCSIKKKIIDFYSKICSIFYLGSSIAQSKIINLSNNNNKFMDTTKIYNNFITFLNQPTPLHIDPP